MSSRFSVEAALKNTVAPAFTSSELEEGVVAADAPEGSYTYAMIASGESVNAADVETSASALEVTVKWGASVLGVTHLSPMRSFTVGDADADFTVSREQLGCERAELVHVAGDVVSIPMLSKNLEAGEKCSVEIGGLTFEIMRGRAGRKVTGTKKPNTRALALGAVGAALHAAVFAGMFAFGPSLESTDEASMTSDQHANVQRMFEAMAEKEMKEELAATPSEASGPSDATDPSEQPKNMPGSTVTKTRTEAIPGDKMHTTNMKVSRADYIAQVQRSSLIELVSSLGPISDDAAFWTSDETGHDKTSSDPGMWLDANSGPFDPTKMLNPNDGGPPQLVKLDRISTTRDCIGLMCKGSLIPTTGLDGHNPDGPKLRPPPAKPGETGVAPELMQRVIRQNFGRFRACYEIGLRSNPALAGRVVVALTVAPDGSVRSAADAGSSLPDPGVVSCIVRNFAGLNFPSADGVGHIVYPLSLSPN